MLLGNYSVLYKSPGRFYGGNTGQGKDPAAFGGSGANRGRFNEVNWSALSGSPDGYRPPYTWIIPQTAGSLASRNLVVGSGSLASTGTLAKLLVSAMTGTGGLSATGTLVVPILCDMAGLGTLAILADTPTGIGIGHSDMTGTSVMTGTLVGSPGWITAAMPGTGTLVGDFIDSPGWLTADITPFAALSPQNLAAAVWDVLATASDSPGTMGEKLNAAGSAGDPWTTTLPGAYSPGTAGDIIGNLAATLLDETDGVETAITMREALRLILAASAGKLSGAAGTTVIIRNVGDSKNRITATVDAAGNRTAVTTDVT